jgi:EmrB/QacA subfamily drug resistance transporter
MISTRPVTGGRRWLVLVVLCLSLVIVGIDSSILNVALPTLVRELGASTSELQWIVDSYIVVFAGLLLVMGSVGDRFGRKGVLSIGLVVFGAASFAAAFSKTPGHLIACRIVMGVGGAMIMPATLSILANVFTDARERRRAIAYWSMTSAAGSTIGPITGGILLRHFWWGSVFLVNVPVVLIALAAGHFLVPTSRNPNASRLDIIGAGLSTAGLSILLYGIIDAPEKGWTSRPTLVTIAAALLVLALFVVWELHTEEPMLDVRFFKDMRLTAAASSITIAMLALTGMMFLVAQLLQFVRGYSPLDAALRVSTPILIINVIVMPITPRIVERIGPKRLVTTGLTVIAIGLALVSLTTAHSTYASLLAGFVLMATGFSLFLPTATDAIMSTLPRDHAGSGSAINQTSRQTGQALGIAIGGSIAASGFRASLAGAGPSGVVSPELLERARESIAGSYRIAEGLDAGVRGPFIHLVNTAFVHGFHLSITVSVAVALVGAVVAFIALPSTLPTHEVEPDAPEAAAATTVVPAEF